MATAKKSSAAKSATAKKAPAEKTPAKKATGKRTLIEPNPGDKRYVRRDDGGRFDESDNTGRSLAADVRKPAKRVVKPGQGDKGDQKPATKKKAAG